MVAELTASPVTHSTTLIGIEFLPKYKVINVVLKLTVTVTVLVVYPAELVTKVYDLKPL